MRTDEFVASLSAQAGEDENFTKMQKNIPLGVDGGGNVVYARTGEPLFFSRHTCVTGSGRSSFLRRLLITLACLHDKKDICFFVLSPNMEYNELLPMKTMDLTLPYIREKADFQRAIEGLKELIRMRESGKGYPRLVVVLDSIEGLENCNRNEDLEEYRAVIELLARREDVDILTGVDLTKSIFSGYPGAFVGVGNCLVATKETGKADVTYVQMDASLSVPLLITYPTSPAIPETVLFFNSVASTENA